ncbi:MAG TPA: protein translocase subunit SecF [Candidatus Saccharimonadales bacterium]|nr:protein translocase subunit SecF [Candidatus Saccharimonadales bacterium]
MEFFHDTKFDFLGKKYWCFALSGTIIVLSIISMSIYGFAYGIDFRGGADVQLKFREAPGIGDLRKAMGNAGFSGLTIQTIGAPENHEVIIRLDPKGGSGDDESEPPEKEDIASEILGALRSADEKTAAQKKLDLNVAGETDLDAALENGLGPADHADAIEAARIINDARNERNGLFQGMDEVLALPGLPASAATWLKDNTFTGSFAIRSVDYVGPAVGGELRSKARWAVGMSLIAMLAYIAFRFQGTAYGIAAILSLTHDVIVVLGFLSFLQKEFDLSVLAAVLTVVGYSVNDTIVIFDRFRENLRLHRQADFEELFNKSLNQTLSRTILTSALVFMVLLCINLFGGSRLDPFSFALLVGVVTGTYSSIYVAAPLVIWWNSMARRRTAKARAR